MLATSLRFPDRPAWRDARNYSPAVAEALTRAYQYLRRGPALVRAYADAHDTIAPWLGTPMSRRQRMHVYYVVGAAYMAVGEAQLATDAYTAGLELAALVLRDRRASAELAYLRACALGWQLHYRAAAADLRDCLALVRALPSPPTRPALAFELTVLGTLAGDEFMFADWASATEHLQQAAVLPMASRYAPVARATVDWIWALLHRWRGAPQEALQHALIACEGYSAAGSPVSSGRSQTVAADISLDLARFFPPGSTRDGYLAFARPYYLRAAILARAEADPVGEDLAALALARATIIAHHGPAHGLILPALRDADRFHDRSLTAAAYTTLGEDFEARGDYEGARICFGEVCHMAEGSDVAAMAVWAKRALVRYDRQGR